MSIRSSEYFIFNGVQSQSFGIFNVNISSGMLTESFTANKSIKEVKIRNNPTPYFMNTEYEKLSFNLSFGFDEKYDSEKIRNVARWLTSPTFYAPLQFSENFNRIFYVMFTDTSELIHNGLSQGYLNLNVVCDSPFSYSPVYNQIINLTSNVSEGTKIIVPNHGDFDNYPTLKIKVINGGSFSITNNSNGGEVLAFTGLANNETLTIDCQAQHIETDISHTYRFSNMTTNSKFLKLIRGNNHLNIKGNVEIFLSTQFKTIQG
ncbi:phage tail domain-containing protein [Paenibacillus sp. FSL H7-0331]|uniref:phage tail domain-containing protein n=1 Tax=Paenibacillus sp. FSL H7-0331 TaxID=1920421 RepID=UPI00096C55D4|nr:phage tail domain-containing protein [Paenibacillus sp. FSL H7-0331]OMF11907.1 hypothetical protein BK127_23420 [Paenibacillus sp. FSL H7-0331]